MSMFNTFGQASDHLGRKENTQRKLDRLHQALRHEEPDRVPISDFFWGGFTRRWRQELGLAADANPYYHYDLDWIVTVPNMDPWIRPFETLRETAQEVVVKTGFGAIILAPPPSIEDRGQHAVCAALPNLTYENPIFPIHLGLG